MNTYNFQGERTLNKERDQIKIFRLPIITFLILSFAIGYVILFASFPDMDRVFIRETELFLLVAYLAGIPISFVIFELVFLITESFNRRLRGEKRIDFIVIVLGFVLELTGIVFLIEGVSYYHNGELHDGVICSPVNFDFIPTVATLLALWFLGYMILEYVPMKKLAPMVAIIAMSAMYIGVMTLAALTIQLQPAYEVAPTAFFQYIYVLPFCWLLITIRVIIKKIHEWKIVTAQRPVLDQEGIGTALEEALNTPLSWPIIAVLMMILVYATVVLILGLFGQPSDSIVKAFTETSGWTFSR